jgi:PAS domain S-box-containing protein
MNWQQRTIRILVVEDDEDDYFLLKEYLNDIKVYSFQTDWVSGYKEAKQAVLRDEHDLYFFDYLLGANTGLDLLREVAPSMNGPVIFLTGKGDRNTDMQAMSSGAVDYLVKAEIDSEKLERSIRYALDGYNTLRALKESEERYRSIFERSRDMIYITDQKGRFLTVNDSASRIFGYSSEEFLNLHASELYLNPEDRRQYLDAINKTGVVSNFEVALKDKHNNVKYCIVSGSLQIMGDEAEVFYHGIIHDITRRKKIEKDLIIAEKLAVTGRIVRTLAHEVRNPLTNINLSVEQLEEEAQNPELHIFTDIIKRNSKRINDLISELLQSSRPAQVNPETIGIKKLLEETLTLAYDRILLKGIEVHRNIELTDQQISVDIPKMRIALLNIIINAIEAMPEKGGEMWLDCTAGEEGKCIISIRDNGSGIAKEDLSRLFEPYFTAKANGVGLGLATTHNIIKSHGGSIDVESEVGKGTNFVIGLKI